MLDLRDHRQREDQHRQNSSLHPTNQIQPRQRLMHWCCRALANHSVNIHPLLIKNFQECRARVQTVAVNQNHTPDSRFYGRRLRIARDCSVAGHCICSASNFLLSDLLPGRGHPRLHVPAHHSTLKICLSARLKVPQAGSIHDEGGQAVGSATRDCSRSLTRLRPRLRGCSGNSDQT